MIIIINKDSINNNNSNINAIKKMKIKRNTFEGFPCLKNFIGNENYYNYINNNQQTKIKYFSNNNKFIKKYTISIFKSWYPFFFT